MCYQSVAGWRIARYPNPNGRKSMFSDIKPLSLSALEQSCQRCAVAVYEVYTGKFAHRFKSVKYSFKNGDTPESGEFTADYTPASQIDDGVFITFTVSRKKSGDVNRWELSDGKFHIIARPELVSSDSGTVSFIEENALVVLHVRAGGRQGYPSHGEFYYVGNSPMRDKVTDGNLEPYLQAHS